MLRSIYGLAVVLALSSVVHADQIAWTDWTLAGNGTVSGVMNLTSGPVNVTYTGPYAFAQLGSGTNFWTEYSPAPYTGNSVVDNAPTASEMVALNSAGTHTISFSQAVYNPVMAIVSQGQPNVPVTYEFDRSFSVLSEGKGFWGDGSYSVVGNKLVGNEFHGVIQFSGWVNSVSWTTNPDEYWHGVTFGAPVPAPSALVGLLGAGVMGLGVVVRRRMSK